MTDEWMVIGIDSNGKRQRLVFHHNHEDPFTTVAIRASVQATLAWGPGEQIISVTNQEETV